MQEFLFAILAAIIPIVIQWLQAFIGSFGG